MNASVAGYLIMFPLQSIMEKMSAMGSLLSFPVWGAGNVFPLPHHFSLLYPVLQKYLFAKISKKFHAESTL
jgi:hypothetical protein